MSEPITRPSWERCLISRVLVVSLLVGISLSGCKEETIAEQYPAPWRQDSPAELNITLGNNRVRGCGEFYFRTRHGEAGKYAEYLVYCTGDGNSWTTYIVFPSVNKVVGPGRVYLERELPFPR